MYSIYSTLYGVEIPEGLNREAQETEVSEIFWNFESSVPDFMASIPYSGDDIADMHVGILLSDDGKYIPNQEDEEKLKEQFEKGRKELIVHMKKEYQEFEALNPLYIDEMRPVYERLIDAVENDEPKFYKAYSTS